MLIHSKAPGKILWLGGYAVLERPNVALVCTVDAYVHSFAKKRKDKKILLHPKNFNESFEGSIDINTGKLDIKCPDNFKLLKTACEITSRYIKGTSNSISGFEIETANDEAMLYRVSAQEKKIEKTGLGSSAAVTVAVISSILAAFGYIEDREVIHKLSQIAHGLATGKIGSGFDIAAATYGTVEYVRYSPGIIKKLKENYSNAELVALVNEKWDYSIKKIKFPKEFRIVVANFVGEAAITTSLVSKTNELKEKNPQQYGNIIEKIDANDRSAIRHFNAYGESKDKYDLEKFINAAEGARGDTKELGVLSNTEIESDKMTLLIEKSKKNGALFSRLPGAGGMDSIAAICMNEKAENELKKFWSEKKYLHVLNLKHNGDGVITENQA